MAFLSPNECLIGNSSFKLQVLCQSPKLTRLAYCVVSDYVHHCMPRNCCNLTEHQNLCIYYFSEIQGSCPGYEQNSSGLSLVVGKKGIFTFDIHAAHAKLSPDWPPRYEVVTRGEYV